MKKTFDKTCKECGKEFKAQNVRKEFCSGACKQRNSKKNNKKEYLHKCLWCEKQFVSGFKKTKFCSFNCAGKHKNNVGIGESFCKQCDSKFKQKHSKQLYCSIKCKREHAGKNAPSIEVKCTYCHRSIERLIKVVKRQTNFFCNIECQSRYNSQNGREYRSCEECKKEFYCKKSEKTRFCSMACQGVWQSKTRTGRNSPTYNHNFDEVYRTRECENCNKTMKIEPWQIDIKRFCSRKCQLLSQKKSLTRPHKIISEILDRLKIEHVNEYKIGRFSIDCYLPRLDVAVEVMGDYWHCNPEQYDFPINDIQLKGIRRDIRKDKILRLRGIRVLYLWENDIYNFPETCSRLIIETIENEDFDGSHSFNYYLDEENILNMKEKLLYPYWK
jgi:very-short-patch-repair endonuclease